MRPLARRTFKLASVSHPPLRGVRKSRGPKSDKRDAFGLAEQLRIGAVGTRVYKGRGEFRRLGCLARGYGFLVGKADQTDVDC